MGRGLKMNEREKRANWIINNRRRRQKPGIEFKTFNAFRWKSCDSRNRRGMMYYEAKSVEERGKAPMVGKKPARNSGEKRSKKQRKKRDNREWGKKRTSLKSGQKRTRWTARASAERTRTGRCWYTKSRQQHTRGDRKIKQQRATHAASAEYCIRVLSLGRFRRRRRRRRCRVWMLQTCLPISLSRSSWSRQVLFARLQYASVHAAAYEYLCIFMGTETTKESTFDDVIRVGDSWNLRRFARGGSLRGEFEPRGCRRVVPYGGCIVARY